MYSYKDINILGRKREAYKRLFLGTGGLKADAEIVLRDLRLYCRANGIIGYRTNVGLIDPLAMANANGRREVYDRLMGFIHLDDKTMAQLRMDQEQ